MTDPVQILKNQLAATQKRIIELEAREVERQHADKVQTAVYTIADAASGAMDLPEFYATMHQIVDELMYAKNFFIALYDHDRQMVNFPYVVDEFEEDIPDPSLWQGIGLGEAAGATSYVLRTQQPLLLTEADFEELEQQGEIKSIGASSPDMQWMGVPLQWDERTQGVLVVQHYGVKDVRYTEKDLALLIFVSQHIATALERTLLQDDAQRLLSETEERNAELSIINSVQAGLVAELDMQAIYDLVGHQLSTIFPNADVGIRIHDKLNNLVHFPYAMERGQRIEIRSEPLVNAGITAHIFRTRQPKLINKNMAAELEKLGATILPGTDMEKSGLYVPLLVGDEARGVIDLLNMEYENAFSDSDVRLLTTLANSMSIALENARLFDETQHLLSEKEERNAELSIINTVQAGLVAELDMQAIYDLVGNQLSNIFPSADVGIRIHDKLNNLVHFPYTMERGQRIEIRSEPLVNAGVTAHIFRTRQPLLINKNMAAELEKLGSYTLPGTEMEKSGLYVPLLIGDEAQGMIDLVDMEHENAFSDSDVRLLTTLANSMSIALENARLFNETQRLLEETRQRVIELSAINHISHALVSELELDALLKLVGEQTREIFNADIAYVALLDRQINNINFPYSFGEDYVSIPYGEGLTSKILETGSPLLLNEDINTQTTALGATIVGQEAQSYLGVPITVSGETTGVLSVQSVSQIGRFDEADMRLLSTIAANVGAALQNAQLYQETQRRANEMLALTEVGREISATLELGTVLERIATHACDLLLGHHSAVFLPDDSGESFKTIVAVGEIAPQLKATTIQLGEGIIGDLAQRGEAEIINDSGHDPRVIQIPGTPEQEEECLLVAPLLTGSQVSGMMAVWRVGADRPFNQTDLDFLTGLARQAVIAVQNARLFEEAEVARKDAEEAREEAESANQAKSTFLANMSHELRTPLNAIIGFTKIVRRKGVNLLPERQIANLEKVLISAEHLLTLINNVLDIAKIEARRMDVTASTFEAAKLVQMCTVTAQPLLKTGVELVNDFEPDLPPLYTDQDKVKQILLNMLSNATKFTHEGKITVRVKGLESALLFEVQDTGIGISPEALGRVFEEFQQADASTTRQYGGTGLGLSISRKLAHLLGGDLTATSVEGEGSTFMLSLPLRYGEMLTPPQTFPAKRLGDKTPHQIEVDRRGGPLIVAIDDDPNAIYLLQENLSEAGYQVIGVESGDEGVQKARELQPMVITLDIMMPNKDGWQVLHDLKMDPATREIPVIILTIVDKQALGYRLGAADYLVKPLDNDLLSAALERLTKIKDGASPKRLLVVDDDPNIHDMVSQLLFEKPFAITSAADGAEALASVQKHPPDAILLDLMMPEMDGFCVLDQLQGDSIHQAIPVIVLTANSLTAEEEALLHKGVVQVIQKQGLTAEALIRELETL